MVTTMIFHDDGTQSYEGALDQTNTKHFDGYTCLVIDECLTSLLFVNIAQVST